MNKRVSYMLRTLATVEGEVNKNILKDLKREWKGMNISQKKVWTQKGKEI